LAQHEAVTLQHTEEARQAIIDWCDQAEGESIIDMNVRCHVRDLLQSPTLLAWWADEVCADQCAFDMVYSAASLQILRDYML
jgi:hypothetical protein